MKSIFESKTFWLAVIQAVGGGVIIYLTEMNMIGGVAIAKSVIDIFLRLATEDEIG